MSMMVNSHRFGSFIPNAAALSSVWKHSAAVLSNGNLTYTHSSTNGRYENVATTDAPASGLVYCEVHIDNVGDGTADTGIAIGNWMAPIQGDYLGHSADAVLYHRDGRTIQSNVSAGAAAGAYTTGDIIGVALDAATGQFYFNKNGGSWAGPFSVTGGPLFLILQGWNTGTQFTVNFGATPFAYTPKAGHGAWARTTKTGRYWRFHRFTGNTINASIAEIQLKETAGGSNNISGGTASASGVFSSPTYAADKAVDGNASTAWVTNNGGGSNSWWRYDYGSGQSKANVEAVISCRNDTLEYATEFALLLSDDGTNFFPASRSHGLTWTQGETKTFTFT